MPRFRNSDSRRARTDAVADSSLPPPYMSTRSKVAAANDQSAHAHHHHHHHHERPLPPPPPQYLCLVVSFIRHGEYDGNLDPSSKASHLNTRGKRQASYLGKQWERVRIDRLYSSTEDRAVDTAVILSSWNVNRPTVRKEKRLIEQRYGRKVMQLFSSGRIDDGFRLLWGTKSKDDMSGFDFDYRPPGGESYSDVIARGQPFIRAILQKYGVKVDHVRSFSEKGRLACKADTLLAGIPHFVVVSHNIFLTLIWETLKHWGGDLNDAGRFHWNNASWSRVALYWDPKTDKLVCVDMKLPEPDRA